FQNMGTASAINIKVSDTIQNQLDVSTLRLLDMSHEGRMQIYNNEVDFIFDDIYLPDSTTDEPNSHGYVLFAIKPRSFVNIGDYIYNEAAIYFDYNEPVITNTTATYIDADSDEDTILDSVDNCPFTANTDQLDSDNDLIGNVCDDGIEVNPPYYMGFDSVALDPFWR